MSSYIYLVSFMSAVTLFYLLICLVIGVWGIAIIGFWYGRKLLTHQKELIEQLIPYMQQVQNERDTIRSLSISDATPLSKLQNVTLPDNIQIDFQHHNSQE